MTQYEYVIALQLVDLNWAILQAKASADSELSDATEKAVRHAVGSALEREASGNTTDYAMNFLTAAAMRMTLRTPSIGRPLTPELRPSWRA